LLYFKHEVLASFGFVKYSDYNGCGTAWDFHPYFLFKSTLIITFQVLASIICNEIFTPYLFKSILPFSETDAQVIFLDFLFKMTCAVVSLCSLFGNTFFEKVGYSIFMRLKEDLYSKIPPSLSRESMPFIPAEVSKLWQVGIGILFKLLLKQKFAAIRIKNRHYLKKRDKTKPIIIYAPHICWWDGMVAYFICRQIFGLDIRFMVEELHLLPMMRKFGAFSIDKKSPKSILKSLNFAVKHLDSPQKVFCIYPQGIIRPQDYSPVKFGSGISYIASNLDGVNLIPLCVRYCFLRDTSPEVLIEVQKPIVINQVENRNEMTDYLEKNFEEALINQRSDIATGDLKKYITVLRKGDNLLRVIEKKLKV